MAGLLCMLLDQKERWGKLMPIQCECKCWQVGPPSSYVNSMRLVRLSRLAHPCGEQSLNLFLWLRVLVAFSTSAYRRKVNQSQITSSIEWDSAWNSFDKTYSTLIWKVWRTSLTGCWLLSSGDVKAVLSLLSWRSTPRWCHRVKCMTCKTSEIVKLVKLVRLKNLWYVLTCEILGCATQAATLPSATVWGRWRGFRRWLWGGCLSIQV